MIIFLLSLASFEVTGSFVHANLPNQPYSHPSSRLMELLRSRLTTSLTLIGFSALMIAVKLI